MLDLASLNPQQRLAVETVDGPVLILAGAGTGKTRVITCRIAYLIRRGVSPRNILAVTFTNKAAREMQERLAGLTGARDRSDRPLISTFHSLCVRILRRHIARLGYKENFVIYSESDQVACLKKILSRISAKGEAVDADAVLRLISRWKNAGANGMSGADPAVAAMADHVRSRYDSALRACNAVDFDDLILLVLKLFADFPEVLTECRERFRFVMVDEYQDTNAAQFRLIQYLAGEHRNLCVVGDDDQSIYGWRGAEAANLLDLERHFPGIKIIKLEQNYRSNATILNAANALIKNNPRRRGKQLWSKNGQGGNILLHVFKDDEEEARVIVEEIQYSRVARGIPWADQAILFRTNQQSRSLETALRQAEVRYHLIGGQSYFDRKEVKDFLAYLKAIVNPDDDVSLLRIANVPARGLSDVTMERLIAASHERQCSVHAVMRHTDIQESLIRRTREQLVSFLELLDRARVELCSGTEVSLRGWADRFFTGIGYFEELRRGERDPTAGENRIRNVKDLIGTLDEAVPGSAALTRIQEFLEELTLDNDRSEEEERTGDAVTLITIHSCKGLEFPHVYIVGLEDGLLPHGRSKLEGTLDEERRLFYVAITRAMRGLTLSYCTGRKRFGQLLPCHPSPFLRELPPELIDDAAKQGKAPVSVDAGKSLFASIRSAIGTGE